MGLGAPAMADMTDAARWHRQMSKQRWALLLLLILPVLFIRCLLLLFAGGPSPEGVVESTDEEMEILHINTCMALYVDLSREPPEGTFSWPQVFSVQALQEALPATGCRARVLLDVYDGERHVLRVTP